MKSIIFSLLALAAGGYLLAQSGAGKAWLGDWFPEQKIERAANDLIEQVDKRVQALSDKQSAEYQAQIKSLERRIVALEDKLGDESPENLAVIEVGQGQVSKVTVSEEHLYDYEHLPQVQGIPEPVTSEEHTDKPSLTVHHKQANLRDIAERMQQVSIKASKG